MQEMSDSLPSSRFNHLKNANLSVFISEFLFRSYPDACTDMSERHRKNVLFNLRNWNVQIESVVGKSFKRYTIRADEFDIQSDMSIDVLKETSRAVIVCTERDESFGCTSIAKDDEAVFTGTSWAMPGMYVCFNLGPSSMQIEKYACNYLSIDCFDEKLTKSVEDGDDYMRQTGRLSHPFLRTSSLIAIWSGKNIDATFDEAKVFYFII